MRKLLAWLVVTIGIAALVRKLRRRREVEAEPLEGAPEAPAPEPAGEDPADELRRKLASTREDSDRQAGASDEREESLEERRADVHDQGRAAIDEMQRSTEE
jgi:flagellar biosynthesis/type III secretory pathway M-ring protein FliF/YscJ